MIGFQYLASPYSKYAGGLDAAAEEASRNAGLLIKAGIPVFCPISHSHAIAEATGIDPLDLHLWLAADRPLMEKADGLIVLMMDGWELSQGIFAETTCFQAMRKPITYMQPGIVPPFKAARP